LFRFPPQRGFSGLIAVYGVRTIASFNASAVHALVTASTHRRVTPPNARKGSGFLGRFQIPTHEPNSAHRGIYAQEALIFQASKQIPNTSNQPPGVPVAPNRYKGTRHQRWQSPPRKMSG